MKQILVWIDDAVDTGAMMPSYQPIDLPEEGKPHRVWTLYCHTDKSKKPELPITPVHHKNAFLEDYIHDWSVHGNKFRFATRVTDKGVWLLFEYK